MFALFILFHFTSYATFAGFFIHIDIRTVNLKHEKFSVHSTGCNPTLMF